MNITRDTAMGILTLSDRDAAHMSMFNSDGGRSQVAYTASVMDCLKLSRPVNMLDIGANIGYISISLMKRGLVDRVLAIAGAFQLLASRGEREGQRNAGQNQVHPDGAGRQTLVHGDHGAEPG